MIRMKEELKIKLEKLHHVYTFAKEAYLYTEYFHNPSTKGEFDLITSSAYKKNLSIIMHLMFRTLIVEVYKLFSRSPNDKFRLDKFIDSLSSSGRFRSIGIPQTHIDIWKNLLADNKNTIDNIILLRNKIYAHTENPMTNYNEIDISFKQIKVLLDIADKILKSVYREIFGAGIVTNAVTFDRKRFSLLRLLAKAEKQRLNEIRDKYMNKGK